MGETAAYSEMCFTRANGAREAVCSDMRFVYEAASARACFIK